MNWTQYNLNQINFDNNTIWDIETICIEFVNPRTHWECYTPYELEVKLNNK